MPTRGGWGAGGGAVRVALVGIVVLGACSSTGSSVREEEVPQIGLQRGGRWSVLNIKPPHLSGPHFHMILKEGVLAGAISGGTAPGGNLRVEIAEDGADGYGPLGPVSMEFITTEDSTTADGMWNGQRVHLVFRRDSVQGTIADNSDAYLAGDPEAMRGMRTFRGRRSRAAASHASQMDPLPRNSSCEYYLNEVAPDGALTGGSTCSGMPQQTRLEVPAVANTWLTRQELVTVLVAVLSAPPMVAAEDMGPRFDSNTPEAPVPTVRRRR